jgi:DNA-binding NarL/FixJ family response regulator
VLALVDRGFSNKEIGQHLYIEAATVRNHVHSILQKLKLRSRAQAANWLRTHNAQASWQRGTFHDDPEPSSA